MENACMQNVNTDPQGWKKQELKLQVHVCSDCDMYQQPRFIYNM
jgi:hypothetical protein